MVYVADLAPVFIEAKRVLAAGGLLAFTTETHDGEGVIIGEGLRYAHSAAYVRATVEAAGLKLSLLEDLSARNEDNVPVPGLVAVAAKTEFLHRGEGNSLRQPELESTALRFPSDGTVVCRHRRHCAATPSSSLLPSPRECRSCALNKRDHGRGVSD